MSENMGTEGTATPVAPAESVTEATDGPTVAEGTNGTDSAEVRALRAQLEAARAEAAKFKRDVVDVTTRYATAHQLCEVTDKALAELGLRRVQTKHRVSVTLEVSWDVHTNTRSGAPSRAVVLRSLETLVSAMRYDGADDLRRRYADRDNGDFPRLVIERDDVTIVTCEGDPDGHLIPAVRLPLCEACGYDGTPLHRATCANCGVPFDQDDEDDED